MAMSTTVSYLRLYADPAGASQPVEWIGDLHPSPLRMWIFVLDGEMEFEASDGEHHRVRPGDALLLEDTSGRGHRSRVIGDTAAKLAVVELEPTREQ